MSAASASAARAPLRAASSSVPTTPTRQLRVAPLASPLRAFPSATRRRARRATRAAAESDKGGWFRPLKVSRSASASPYTRYARSPDVARTARISLVRAPPTSRAPLDIPSSAPRLVSARPPPPPSAAHPHPFLHLPLPSERPPRRPRDPRRARGFLESMLQWHLGNSTSTDLVLREVQDAIVQEVTSFPVERWRSATPLRRHARPHLPPPRRPAGDPATVADMGAASVALSAAPRSRRCPSSAPRTATRCSPPSRHGTDGPDRPSRSPFAPC